MTMPGAGDVNEEIDRREAAGTYDNLGPGKTQAEMIASLAELRAARESERVGLATYREQADRLQQALTAERDRAEKLESELVIKRGVIHIFENAAKAAQVDLQVEREKSAEHLDAANWLTLERERLILEVERLEAERDRRLGQ